MPAAAAVSAQGVVESEMPNRIHVFGRVLASAVAAVFIGLVWAAIQLGGVVSVFAVRATLVTAFIVGLIGILLSPQFQARRGRPRQKLLTCCVVAVLAVPLLILDLLIEFNMPRPSPSATDIAKEVATQFADKGWLSPQEVQSQKSLANVRKRGTSLLEEAWQFLDRQDQTFAHGWDDDGLERFAKDERRLIDTSHRFKAELLPRFRKLADEFASEGLTNGHVDSCFRSADPKRVYAGPDLKLCLQQFSVLLRCEKGSRCEYQQKRPE